MTLVALGSVPYDDGHVDLSLTDTSLLTLTSVSISIHSSPVVPNPSDGRTGGGGGETGGGGVGVVEADESPCCWRRMG